jgi:hypothetical protein
MMIRDQEDTTEIIGTNGKLTVDGNDKPIWSMTILPQASLEKFRLTTTAGLNMILSRYGDNHNYSMII